MTFFLFNNGNKKKMKMVPDWWVSVRCPRVHMFTNVYQPLTLQLQFLLFFQSLQKIKNNPIIILTLQVRQTKTKKKISWIVNLIKIWSLGWEHNIPNVSGWSKYIENLLSSAAIGLSQKGRKSIGFPILFQK